jgi:predicted RNA-binding Zn ribbon-like protein
MVRDDAPSRAGALALVGGDLALDFANTCSGRNDPAPLDHLQRPEHVAQWAGHARILAPADAQWLQDAATGALGARLLGEAHALRSHIYEIGAALSAGRPAPPDAAEGLAKSHAQALGRAALTPLGARFGWTWRVRETPVEAVLGPISLSALTLLQQGDLSRVKQCGGESCGWLFFDATKNKSRRWCEMEVCGNRAKQKRFGDRMRRA